MAYSRTTWVQEETQLNARNMNNIEDGIEESLALLPAVEEALARTPNITSGTTDLEEGVSQLATGAIYLVYEE